MALENREGGKYITIMGGKFVVRVPEGTPGSKSRVNKVGKTVHEVSYDSFTGKLVNVRVKDGEYGKTWEFDFQDAGEVYTLQLSYSSSMATNLLKILPNCDLTKEMKVQPSQKIEDGKTKSSLFISQNGTTLKHAYTKDKPNGLPQMEQIQVKGQLVWDDSKRVAFLYEMVQRDILPKLSPVSATPAEESNMEADVDDVFGTGATGGADDDF